MGQSFSFPTIRLANGKQVSLLPPHRCLLSDEEFINQCQFYPGFIELERLFNQRYNTPTEQVEQFEAKFGELFGGPSNQRWCLEMLVGEPRFPNPHNTHNPLLLEDEFSGSGSSSDLIKRVFTAIKNDTFTVSNVNQLSTLNYHVFQSYIREKYPVNEVNLICHNLYCFSQAVSSLVTYGKHEMSHKTDTEQKQMERFIFSCLEQIIESVQNIFRITDHRYGLLKTKLWNLFE